MPSTYQGFGDDVELSISDEKPLLIRFDLTTLDGTALIQSATLRLFKFEDYGGGSMDIGVFRSSQGRDLPPSDPIFGISSGYPDDDGIGAHSDGLLFMDFEGASWGDDWTSGSDRFTMETVTRDPSRLFEPFQGAALRVRVPGGENTGMSLLYKFMDEIGEEPEEIWFRCYLRFAEDWLPSDGGKLPVISGTYGAAGWGGRPVDGTDGWSARGTYRVSVPDGNPFADHSTIGQYVYHSGTDTPPDDIHLYIDNVVIATSYIGPMAE